MSILIESIHMTMKSFPQVLSFLLFLAVAGCADKSDTSREKGADAEAPGPDCQPPGSLRPADWWRYQRRRQVAAR